MLQFAAPLGLLALGALLAPILIHLVRRPRRVVKIGSLRPLQDARRELHSLRWHELLLLALRCGLLVALVLSLAGLRWQPSDAAPAKWLLLAPGASLDSTTRAQWDQLCADGFEPRALSVGFPRTDPSESAISSTADTWSLLREIDLTLPAGSHVVVFGPTTAGQFRGERPALSNVDVTWHETAVEVPPPTSRVTARVGLVAANDRSEDARYVRAALAAIGATLVTDAPPDWIVQLGDVELPTAWRDQVDNGARLVTDAPNAARAEKVARWFDAGANRVRISRRVTPGTGAPVLRDSAGSPLLTEERQGAGYRWRFAIRFHPDWSDWPLESSFPTWWREQLNRPIVTPIRIAPAQAAPRFSPASPPVTPALPGFGRIDLRGWSWLLAAMLFGAERALSWSAQRRRATA